MLIPQYLHLRVRTLKVGNQDLDFAAWDPLANGLYREREQFRAAVLAIIAINARHHGIFQSQDFASFGYAPRFIVINCQRRAFLHGAKSAAPGANVAQDHERGRPSIPALSYIGT